LARFSWTWINFRIIGSLTFCFPPRLKQEISKVKTHRENRKERKHRSREGAILPVQYLLGSGVNDFCATFLTNDRSGFSFDDPCFQITSIRLIGRRRFFPCNICGSDFYLQVPELQSLYGVWLDPDLTDSGSTEFILSFRIQENGIYMG
jgi:hypothetical protein